MRQAYLAKSSCTANKNFEIIMFNSMCGFRFRSFLEKNCPLFLQRYRGQFMVMQSAKLIDRRLQDKVDMLLIAKFRNWLATRNAELSYAIA